MNKKFYNPSRYQVNLTGPNKEVVTMKGGSYKILSDFYMKYCPKHIIIAEEGVPSTQVPQPHQPNINISQILKSTQDRRYVHTQQPASSSSGKQSRPIQNQKHVQNVTNHVQHKVGRKVANKIVGRTTVKHAEATKLFKKHLEINQISISNDVGVGILSYNRLDSIKRLLESIKNNTDLNKTTIFVSDESSDIKVKEYLRSINWIVLLDNDKRLGIAGNTNRLLRCLSRFKYKILLNDDVTIKKSGWDTFYVSAMQKLQYHHFCYRQPGVYGAKDDAYESIIASGHRIKTIKDKPHGAVMVFDNVAFDKVGYFDTEFGMYGMEHVDWSYRIWKSCIQPPGYHDIDGSEEYFTINADVSACENRTACLTAAKTYFDKVKNSRIKVEVDKNSVVPSVTYIIPFRDQDGRNAIYSIINNIKSQRFPDIELILVEQASHQLISQILPFRHIFIQNNEPFNKSKAFNYGVAVASNNVIILHDADIMATDNYTAEVYKILQKFKSCHIGKNVMYVDREGTDNIIRTGTINTNTINCERIVGYFEGGSLACYRDEYIRIGGFNEVFSGYGNEDCEFFERLKTNTNMYDERYIDFVHAHHGRSTGWEALHKKNVDMHKKLSSIPMQDRILTLRSNLRNTYNI